MGLDFRLQVATMHRCRVVHAPLPQEYAMLNRFVIALVLWAVAAGFPQAQVPPPPPDAGVFADRDNAARVWFRSLHTDRGRAQLQRHLQRKPDDSRAWSASAFLHAQRGDAAAALADLERARGVIVDSPLRERETLWSEGWIRLTLGQVPEARNAWVQALRLHGGRPYWVPYTFAVLAELGGERHTALAWYERAARAMPARWGTRHGMLAHTRHWQASERAAMVALYEAWAAQRDGTTAASQHEG